MRERKSRSVLQSAIADGDGMRKPPGRLITGAGRWEEVLRKGLERRQRREACVQSRHLRDIGVWTSEA